MHRVAHIRVWINASRLVRGAILSYTELLWAVLPGLRTKVLLIILRKVEARIAGHTSTRRFELTDRIALPHSDSLFCVATAARSVPDEPQPSQRAFLDGRDLATLRSPCDHWRRCGRNVRQRLAQLLHRILASMSCDVREYQGLVYSTLRRSTMPSALGMLTGRKLH